MVAPLVGAWIETRFRYRFPLSPEVAPLVGAWIETLYLCRSVRNTEVAPLVGAWIETLTVSVPCRRYSSRPSRRGVD